MDPSRLSSVPCRLEARNRTRVAPFGVVVVVVVVVFDLAFDLAFVLSVGLDLEFEAGVFLVFLVFLVFFVFLEEE